MSQPDTHITRHTGIRKGTGPITGGCWVVTVLGQDHGIEARRDAAADRCHTIQSVIDSKGWTRADIHAKYGHN